MRRWRRGAVIGLGLVLLAAGGLLSKRQQLAQTIAGPDAGRPPPAAEVIDTSTEAGDGASHLFVLAINGGGSTTMNFKSHLLHLQGMVDLLHTAGVPNDHITVLSSDGADPTPDLIDRIADVGPDEWRLYGTDMEPYLSNLAVLSNSAVTGATLFPATRGALSIWLMTVGQQLRAGDTLLLYVTDHGALGPDSDGNRIVLWGPGTTLSVRELRELLETINPEVRVVALMSQCYSGGFASLAGGATGEPTGRFCGFFSTTSHRRSYGCYPETRDNPRVGHAFSFLQALPAAAGRLSMAHELTQEFDDTPDVPVRTSELYVEDVLAGEARAHKLSSDSFVDDLLRSTWSNTRALSLQAQRLDRLSERFGLPSVRSLAELGKVSATLQEALTQLGPLSTALDTSLAEFNQHELGRFLAVRSDLKTAVDPGALKSADFDRRLRLGKSFLYDLGTFCGGRAPAVKVDRDTVRRMVFRMEVRMAAVRRLKTVLVGIAGEHYLAASPNHRANLQKLVDCETLDLPIPATQWVTPGPALPPLGQDLIQLRDLSARESIAGLVKRNAVGVGDEAPEFRLLPYRGELPPSGSPVLLFFWATWCKACKFVVPSLLTWAQGHNVPVLAITDEDAFALDEFFLTRPQFPSLVARDPEQRLFSQFGIRNLPSFALLDGHRKLACPVTSSLQELPADVAP
jgi:thiol-disulfide isomerase/thioredoxin